MTKKIFFLLLPFLFVSCHHKKHSRWHMENNHLEIQEDLTYDLQGTQTNCVNKGEGFKGLDMKTLFSDPKKGRRLKNIGLGAVSFTNTDSLSSKLIGRLYDRSRAKWVLTLLDINWNDLALAKESLIVVPSLREFMWNKGHPLDFFSGYDPIAVDCNGEVWIAFECNGQEDDFGPSSICAGPLISETGVLDMKRTHLVVAGQMYPNESASVPKFLVHKGKLYLYWTVVEIEDNGHFRRLYTRGMQVVITKDGLTSLYTRDSEGIVGISATDPRTSIVWVPSPGEFLADMSDIISDGETIYALSAVGKCTLPLEPVDGCYRLALSKSKHPLGYRIFNNNDLEYGPPNTQNYATFMKGPENSFFLMIEFLNARGRSDQDIFPMKSGVYVFDL